MKSEKAVSCVLQGIKKSIPELSDLMERILENLPQISQVLCIIVKEAHLFSFFALIECI